MVTLVLIN